MDVPKQNALIWGYFQNVLKSLRSKDVRGWILSLKNSSYKSLKRSLKPIDSLLESNVSAKPCFYMQVQRRKKVRPRDGLKEGLAPRLPNKPLFYYKHYAETNAFVPKIDERYEL